MEAGPLTCLLHGDSWSNNVLFRYAADDSSHKPTDMRLIDWQIARIGHSCFDLGYFLFSSTSSDFRREHLDRLWQDYFAVLKSALSKLGIDLETEGYDQDRFMRERKERYVLMLFIALFILPILLDASKAADHTLKDKEISPDGQSDDNGITVSHTLYTFFSYAFLSFTVHDLQMKGKLPNWMKKGLSLAGKISLSSRLWCPTLS